MINHAFAILGWVAGMAIALALVALLPGEQDFPVGTALGFGCTTVGVLLGTMADSAARSR